MTLRPSIRDRRTNHPHVLKWIKRLALIGSAAVAAALIVRAWLPKPVEVDVATVRYMQLVVYVEEDGKTRVRDRYAVSAPIMGNLERIELEPGASVAAGDVVARISPPEPGLIDPRSLEEARARLTAAVAREQRTATAIVRASAARSVATRDAARARTLAANNAISAADREHAELSEQTAIADLTAAYAERAAARAEVAMVRAVLGSGSGPDKRTVVVTAPATGQVLRVVRDSAGPVVAGSPLIELGDPRSIEVVVDVLSTDAARIAVGAPVEVSGWGGEQILTGHVHRVEPSAFTQISALGVEEQRVNVIAGVDDPPASLGDGFRVDAKISTWRSDRVLAIAASALFRAGERWAVFAVEQGRARLRHVDIGHRSKLAVEVLAGLREGAQLIVHPSDRVVDGAKVAVREQRP